MLDNVYHGWNHLRHHWILLLVLVVHQHHCSCHSSEAEQVVPELLAAGCMGNITTLKGFDLFYAQSITSLVLLRYCIIKTRIFQHLSSLTYSFLNIVSEKGLVRQPLVVNQKECSTAPSSARQVVPAPEPLCVFYTKY